MHTNQCVWGWVYTHEAIIAISAKNLSIKRLSFIFYHFLKWQFLDIILITSIENSDEGK